MEEEWATGPPCDDEHDHRASDHHQGYPDIGQLAQSSVQRDIIASDQDVLGQIDADPTHEYQAVDMVLPRNVKCGSAHNKMD